MSERFAIYYAPPNDSALWTRACAWLGRDPSGADVLSDLPPRVARDRLDERSVSARRYGFHATIKAPFRLGFGHDRVALETALADFAATMAPVAIGPLKLALLDGFLALVPAAQSEALTHFAARVVSDFDTFRAPATAEERERRTASGKLTPRQLELMERLGYPYVYEQFQLHMTLTDRLAEPERNEWFAAAAAHFGPLASADTLLDRLVLFHEAEPGAPFTRLADYPLTGAETA
jgi:putative phosphonate metabolism protein